MGSAYTNECMSMGTGMVKDAPLNATHREECGRLVEFAACMMPVQLKHEPHKQALYIG